MPREYVTQSAKETQNLGANLAKEILLGALDKKAVIIALEGELGAGKTTFTQGFAKALGIKGIKSPTFVLMKHYKIKKDQLKRYFYHLDCYRLKDRHDLKSFNIEEIFSDPASILLIEWPERIAGALPNKYIRVHIDHLSFSNRKITIS